MANLARMGEGSGAALVIVIASALALATAFTAQYAFGLAPCVLCLYQRIPYAVAIFLGLACLPAGMARLRPLLLGLAALVFVVNAGIAVFHAGVEWQFWSGTAGCTGAGPLPTTTQDLFKPAPARCDEAAWTMFGLSMAGYNVLASAVLAIFAFLAARRTARLRA
jgi:disulfide bond formation protein DsbB